MKRFVLLCLLCLSGPLLHAQVTAIDDTFDAGDPCEPGSGWECIGSVAWVDPLADPCPTDDPNFFNPWATFDPLGPCTQYEGEGYVVVTPAVNTAGGHMFRSEAIEYDNFKLTAVVELRDGSIGRPADGMCIVIIGTESPPPQGALGGAMGATGMGAVPTMIFEFDNWSCNGGDNNDQNHVQFAWSATGFPAVDGIPISPPPYRGVFTRVNEAMHPLNNRLPHPAPNNRFTFEVLVQAGVVACYLSNEDTGMPRTPMYNFTIPGFEPFTGFLGVTGSTGNAWQNQLLHSIKIEQLPAGFCLAPAGLATRDFQLTRTPQTDCGDFSAGDNINVSITIDARDQSALCSAPVGANIVETLPEGWTASNISDGGVFSDPANTVTWTNIPGGSLEGKVLTYRVTAAATTDITVFFSGTITETIAGSEPAGIVGETELTQNTAFDACGGIRCWNILGGLAQPYFDNPGDDNIRRDFLTDGESTETDFPFFPGGQVAIAFGGDGQGNGAASTGLVSGTSAFNPGGVPEVFAWNDRDNFINLNDDIFGGDPNNVMAYAQAYVVNTTGAPMEVYIGSMSDDSIQILLNGEEVWIHSIPRGGQDLCIAPQDVSPDGVTFTVPHILQDGPNSLIVKVFEGGGGWNFGVRFQDELGAPITEGLEVVKIPPGACIVPPLTVTRDIATTETVLIEWTDQPKWSSGNTYTVSLNIADIRAASGSCGAPTSVTIREIVPAGWTASAPSDGGTVGVGGLITWNLTGGAITPRTLTYQVTAGSGAGTVLFRGTVTDPGFLGKGATLGESNLYNPTITTPDGFATEWLLLTPYRQSNLPTANPIEDLMRLDYLTDGINIDELGVAPEAGDTVNTDYNNSARSTGLEPTVAPLNPGGVPTWHFWRDLDDTINYERVHQGNEDNLMSYAFVYVNVDADIVTDIGLASDDAVHVLLDGNEIWINSIARGSGLPGTIQDVISSTVVPALNPLTAGQHRLLVKVFEGGGDHNFRLRFQDASGVPITSGITTCTSPVAGACVSTPVGEPFRRGDSDSTGDVNITDGVFILNYLFLGGDTPTCLDAADSDDTGDINITDGVFVLNYLFLGGDTPPAPGPSVCGPDPSDDPLTGCADPSC